MELLRLRSGEDPGRRAYTFLLNGEVEEGHLTYGELDLRARAVAARLQALGARGERALLLYPPGLEYVAALFGCFYAGTIAVPAYPPHRNKTDPRLQAIVADCAPTLALTTRELLGEAERLCAHTPELGGLRWMATEDVPVEEAEGWRNPEVVRDAVAFLQYTSGSTASPKGVMVSHGNLLHNFAVIEELAGYTPETRSVIWLPPYHDMGLIGGILQPLFTGYWAALFSPVAFIQRPARWLEAVSRYRVTSSGGPNFAYELCVHAVRPEEREGLDLSRWEIAFNGAEPVRAETLRAFAESFAPQGFRACAFYPCYGLAEATLMVTGSRPAEPPVERAVDADALGESIVRDAAPDGCYRLVGSGRSALSQRVIVVDPATLRECPADRVGEVWVAGSSVAQGYWGRPEATAETFGGYEAESGEGPFLRTGDLGFLDGGELFITGRLKDLIVIRGRNHYPQDIEITALRSHAGLRAGFGVAFSVDGGGEERLVVVQEVSRQGVRIDVEAAAAAIRRAVAAEHGLQVHAVAVVRPGGVPKTSSGKVQRRACRARFQAGELPLLGVSVRDDAGSAAPRVESVGITRESLEAAAAGERQGLLEELLVERAAAVLGMDPARVDREQPLVALGLDSLRAMELKGALETSLGAAVPISSLLGDTWIEHLAAELLEEVFLAGAVVPAGAAASGGDAPLSFAQERLWFLDRLQPGSAAYNLAGALHLRGEVDAPALRRSLEEIVRRHDTLRTVFAEVDGRPVQRVRPAGALALPEVDLSRLDAEVRNDAARRVAREVARAPFDLEAGPPFRVRLLRLGRGERRLVLVMHHIVGDGWSAGVLIREVAALYPALLAGKPSPLPPLPTRYADWALRQRQGLRDEAVDAQLAYWRERLRGVAPLPIPTDRPRPPAQSFRGATHRFDAPREVIAGVRALARAEGATHVMALLAAWSLLLARYAGEDDVAVGTPVANRDRAEVAGLVGLFVDTVVLRVEVAPQESFRALLGRARAAALEAFARQDVPFERLVEEVQPERDLSRNPIFQVMLAPQSNLPERVEVPGATLVPEPLETGAAILDLTLYTRERSGGALEAALEYAVDLFEAATAERMAAHLVEVLRAVAAAPDLAVAEIPLLLPAERVQVLQRWNDSAADYPSVCVHELFAAQVARTPDAPAIRFGGRTTTYAELERSANRLAHRLRALGADSETRVGLCAERTPEMVVAMLGVLKAGGAYVPLDPAYPGERLEYMLADAGVAVVVTNAAVAERLPVGVPRLLLDAEAEPIPSNPDTPSQAVPEPGNLAYVLYTSGSTGRPKGVQVEHRSVSEIVHFLRDVVRPEDRAAVLGSTSISFDVSAGEIFGTLCWGGTLVLVESVLDLPRVADEEVRLVVTVPSAAVELLRAGGIPESVRSFNLAGEALPASLARDLYALPHVERVLNLYGPTEDTVYSTWAEVERGAARVHIGRPVANSRAYVLDPAGNPVPVGVAGELCLGGAGTARGYHGRPGLTAERFVPDAFAAKPGARMYRTGDLARWLARGELEYLGRADQQVKVRGFRIEPGEVESALQAHPRVGRAVVVARADHAGVKRLVAYVVPAEGPPPSAEELRAWLRLSLPEHMIPAAFVALDALPLTPSGKTDRRALPEPEAESAAVVAPRTAVEEVLSGIWTEVLGLERMGVEESFFDLGGHSLLATQVVSRVRQVFGVEVSLRALFQAPTVGALAGHVEELRGAGAGAAPPVEPVSREVSLPLSFAQQRLWVVDRLEPGSAAYNMAGALRLRGGLNMQALRASLDALAARHETLRTTFPEHGGAPVQVVHPPAPVALAELDLRCLPEAERDAEAERLAAEEAVRPFDLAQGPLLRAALLRMGEEDHVLCFTLHHIVGDGWSLRVLVRELSVLYAAYDRGEAPRLSELPVQYADFAVWQRDWLSGETLEAQLAYWRERLAGAPPLLDIPTDRPRTAGLGARAGSHRFALSPETARGLRALGRREGGTLFMSLLAGWQALLDRYAGQGDVVVGSPVAGRTRRETEGVIGFFVNMLALRADLAGGPTWGELLRRVREDALGAYAHQDLPFERLVEALGVERSLTYTPLFQVVLALDRSAAHEGLALGEAVIEPFETEARAAKFDLELTLSGEGEELRGELLYRRALFEAETVARMAGHLEVVLETMASAPGDRLTELSLLRGAERAQVLETWNATVADVPALCVHDLFTAQAARTPGAAAVQSGAQTLTYGELERRSGALARRLRGRGVGPEVRVGVCLERGPGLLVGLLGVLRAGGAYVPLDPSYPRERLAYMLTDARVPVLLTEEGLAPTLSEHRAEVVLLDDEATGGEGPLPDGFADPRNAAYVIYTSGSTGRPKGVTVPHGAVVNLLFAMQRLLALGPADVLLAVTPLSFDISALELFLPLAAGATVAPADAATASDGTRLRDALAERGPSLMQATPATWQMLLEAGWEGSPGLAILCGGEALAPELAARLRRRGAALWNVYGPTETTIWSTAADLTRDDGGPVTVGRPLGNTRVHVLDRYGLPVPAGVPGALFIGGNGVARGYLDRPELTAERFVPDPFAAESGARLYDTGDRARFLADGRIEHLGRADEQVKVRGFRIEPAEVESALLQHPAVRRAVVAAHGDRAGGKRLVAYVVPAEGPARAPSTGELRAWLRRALPEHMVPSAVVALETLPLTPSGKVDRRALPEPDAGSAGAEPVAPSTPVEEILAGIWAEVLGAGNVGVHDDFFALGGHSLLGTRVVSRVRDALGAELPLRALFEAPTVAQLAGRVEELRSTRGEDARLMAPVPRGGPLPMSFAQQRLWLVDRLEPGSAAYNMAGALRLRGPLDTAALRASLDSLARRHEALRTTFAEQGGALLQVIHPAAPVALGELDLLGVPDAGREAERLAAEEAARPFDLARGPLLRATLLRLAGDDHVLLFTLHHAVGDGWSTNVLVREVSTLYDAFARGEEPALPDLPVQYADYAVWQRKCFSDGAIEAQVGYWKERLAGAPPLLEIPVDRPRAAGQGALAGRHRFALPPEVSRGLRALSRREGATLFMTLLAAWQALLGRHAGQDDVVVGTPVAGRTRLETEGVVGFFVNMLALRVDLAGEPDGRELLSRVREAALGAYAHQELPFERLVETLGVERSLTWSPVFQAIFALDRPATPRRFSLGGVSAETFEAGPPAARFDLELAMVEEGADLRGEIVFRAALFDAQTIARVAGHLEALLEALAADAGRRLAEVPLLRGAERVRVLHAWNDTRADYPRVCVHELFSAQAARTPGAVALAFDGGGMTYAALEAGANRLAHLLRDRGVGPEVRVGISVEKGPEMALGVLGVLKAGGAYVPIDPAYPAERIGFMLRDSGAALLLTQSHLAGRFRGAAVPVLALDALAAEPASGPAGAPESGAGPESLAYVIYTSGSTGTPKGVAVPHRAVVNLATDMAARLELRADDRLLQFASLSFDVSVEEIFTAWTAGAAVVLTRAELFAPGALREVIEREGVTSFELPSAYWAEWVRGLREGGWRVPASVRFVRVGGERVPPERLRDWARLEVPLVHVYGVTEATCTSAALRLGAGEDAGERASLPIGRPTGNVRLYVLDRGGEPVPVGVPGELYIGGEGVARGYLGRAELTAEKFVPDPFGGVAGARLYRSGDRARWLSEGTVEFLGRIDTQVKVRGFRIEPGEVEAALRACPGVREAVVIVGADVQRLAGYVVAEEGAELGSAELRSHVAGRLPEHMVPGAFVVLERLPLTPSGKVDRRALPAPRWGVEGTYVAPRTPAEEVMAGIWAEVLGTERVGVQGTFFELGGHSLLAAQVVSRVRQAFGTEVPLRALFEAPNVAALVRHIEELRWAGTPAAPPITPVPRTETLPLSFAQQRLWIADRLEPGSATYNMPGALRLRGLLHTAALRASLDALVRRHEVLRTTFAESDTGPVQVIHEPASVRLVELDLAGLPEEEREREAERLAAEEALRPFDLTRGPLLRSTLLRLADDDHVLLFTLHHVVGDGWSMDVLVREVSALHAAFGRGEEPRLPELAVQYADFAVWQRNRLHGEVLEEQLAYWRERLAGAPPLLDLPTDRPRMAGQASRAGSHGLVLSPDLSDGLRALSRREGTTLFMTTLAAWQVLMGRYAGQEDVVVGSPTAGRTRKETEGLIGFFVNMLALRADLGADLTWHELLGQVRETALGAYTHQELPFERLVDELGVERSLVHTPVFQVVFALQRGGGEGGLPSLGELALEPFGGGAGLAKFDLTLTMEEGEDGLGATLSYRMGLFEAETAGRMAGHLEATLEAMAAAPGRRLSELSLLRADERTQVVEAWNATAAPYPQGCVHQLFARQAVRTPGAVAVICGEGALTYAELDRRTNQLAHHLKRRGAGPEVPVGLLVERSAEMVVAVLGILKTGGAYVPLDPGHPPERLRLLLEDVGAPVLLTQKPLAGQVEGYPGAVVYLDADGQAMAGEPDGALAVEVDPHGAAYVIYTSGSTGTPKGVLLEHGGLAAYLAWFDREVLGAEGFALPLVSSLSFDAHVRQLFPPLLRGEAVWVLPEETVRDPAALLDALCSRERVSFGGVPSLWSAVLDRVRSGEGPRPAGLRAVLLGGEALPAELAERTFATFPSVALWNHYGPTETTVNTTAARVRPEEPVSIGRPIANVRVYLLDGHGHPVPVGVPGELHVGGAGVSRGYVGRAELTADRFLPDPFSAEPGARMYRSGDRARWVSSGELEYVGRVDAQVKVRGFRIEPGEVEAALARHPRVCEAVVVSREDRLVAYLVAEEGVLEPSPELRAYLRERLPEHMVPAAFVTLDRLPLNRNGKVDRRALPAPEAPVRVKTAPRTVAEELLCGIWAEVLGAGEVGEVGTGDDFFALGGHSLLATQVVSRARRVFGVELPLRALFESPTVARLAERIAALQHAGACDVAPPLDRACRGQPLPLSFAQQRLWIVDRLDPDGSGYNMPYALRLRGALDVAVLRRSFDALVRRHETLRTVFAEGDGAPVQVVRDAAPVKIELIDLGSLPSGAREGEALRLAGEEALRPFDLSRGPLLRIALLRLGDREHVLCFTLHHIVSDGWSTGVLVREVSALFDACSRGEEPRLPELPVQYADYAVWQRGWLSGEVLEAQLAYWKARLAGAPPLLEIPTDRPRAAGQGARADRHTFSLGVALTRRLRELSRREGATLFMTALAGWQTLLGRYAGQDDVVVGTPVAGRSRVELEGLIGFFVNILPLRVELGGDPAWSELLVRVREEALGAYTHQDLPFERLVDEVVDERTLTHAPLVQVAFSLARAVELERLSLGGVELEPVGVGEGAAKFDVHLSFSDTGDGLDGALLYRKALFEPATIARMAGHLEILLGAMVADPAGRCSGVSLLRGAERTQVLEAWNPAPTGIPPASVHELFAEQAARSPDAVAVVFRDESLTYAELDRRANRLAHHLLRLGVTPEEGVGVCLERSPELVVGVLGILKAGAAYVPLDPSHPGERLREILTDAGVRLVLTAAGLGTHLPAGARVVRLDVPGTVAALAAAPPGAPRVAADPRQLAYVIYTSGSTGRPKGVAVPHRAVVRLVRGTNYLAFGPEERIAQASNPAFDAATFEIWGALLGGGCVVVIGRDVALSPTELAVELRERRVSTLFLTTALFNRISHDAPGAFSTLRNVLFGGEAVDAESVRRILESGGPERLLHVYGPTETTTFAAWHRVRGVEPGAATVPIGAALGNTTLYVLDGDGEAVPVGIAGELYVGGPGLARGYLGRSELTAERFVPDAYSGEAGARLYRTGDRVRWNGDGAIEFLGRVDAQVKIRGFRIEPAEVEAVLLEQERVREAVVVAREDGGEKRLVAYVAGDAGLSDAELRGALRARLPEYLVPAAIVPLEEFPLTPHGKVDRRALPLPRWGGDAEAYTAPTTAVESLLCGIWTEALGVDRVGMADNFFDLGGDSILAIQVVSRARRYGLKIAPRQLFECPTIARLAEVVEPMGSGIVAAEGPVAGQAPLTPIQRWFFTHEQAAPHHFNQALLLTPRERLDPLLLDGAAAAVESHHDALRLRFRRGEAGAWTQVHAGLEDRTPLAFLDLARLPGEEQRRALETAAEQVQRSLDLAQGPLLRAALLELGRGGQRLLVVVHHLVVDGVSWRILLEDLETAYTQLARGEAVLLPAKTTSWRAWAELLAEHARSATVAEEAEYWTAQAAKDAVPLPADDAEGENIGAEARVVAVRLGADETEALLREVPRAYRTRIDDVLLCGLARALSRWTATRRIRVELEGHGRAEDRVEGVDLSRTVGWFTSMYPVVLELPEDGGVGAALQAVKEQLRAVPGKGTGYGLLRYLSGSEASAELARVGDAEVVFNYLGQFDQTVSAEAFFAFAPESAGASQDPRRPRSHLLAVNGAVREGCLELQVGYAGVHRRETMERLADWYAAELRELIAHCRSVEAGGCTPSDFPLAGLDQAGLDALLRGERGVEDIYPLTPLQEGMLFHALYAPRSGVYVGQLGFVLEGMLDAQALERAWQGAVDRHEALRASFVWEGVPRPVQVIRGEAKLPLRQEDWRGLGESEREERLELYLDEDRKRGFELGRGPLMRLGLFRVEEEAYQLVWTHHHLILDGWSLSLLFGDVLSLYGAYARGESPRLGAARRYREYVAWLERQDRSRAEHYWRDALAGLEAPTALPGARTARSGEKGHGEAELLLSVERTEALQEQARRWGVTLNTVVQGAWALLLSRYTGEEDVVFGATVSGRPAELAGAGETVGMFINTLPVRVRVRAEAGVGEWLAQVQGEQVEAREYEYAPLAQVQKWSGVAGGEGLFESLVVFENYPVDRALEEAQGTLGGVRVRRNLGREQASYPLVLVAQADIGLRAELRYETARVEEGAPERTLEHLEAVLDAMGGEPGRRLAELSLLRGAERTELLGRRGAATFPQACVHELFAQQARRTPDAAAVVSGGETLSYRELDRRADRLAHHLRRRGVGPEVRVAVCAERSTGLVVALLGVLKAGGAYVPVDPTYPSERIAYLLEDSGCAAVLVQGKLRALLGGRDTGVVVLEEALAESEDGEAAYGMGVEPDNAAYLIYTSGSTGRPKGVVVTHGNVSRLFAATREWFGFGEDDVWALFHSYAFDFSVWEMWGALLHGGRLVVVPWQTSRDPEAFYALLESERVTVLNQTPSAFRQLVAVEEDRGASARLALRVVVFGGEALELRSLRGWMERHGEERPLLVNMYGITETTVHVTYRPMRWSDVEAGEGSPVGEAIPDLYVRVLDPWGSPVPVGVPGELHVGGAGVARGYLGRPELTAERFVPDAFGSGAGARLYRSGDRVRWLATGELEYLGRGDAQVKVRGFRIEPGEIEAELAALPRVREAVVVVREDVPGQKRLVAYVVGDAGAEFTGAELREGVSKRLPEHMVPAAFVPLERLPLNANGKVDRRALPAPEGAAAGDGYVGPRTEVEKELAAVWSEVLGVERVGVEESFFELGGDSILSIQVVSRARRRGLNLMPRQLFERPTIARLAQVVERADRGDTTLPQGPVTGEAPLTPIQRRFFEHSFPARHHFNHALMLVPKEPLSAEVLARVAGALEAHHDALRLRFRQDDDGAWRQSCAGVGERSPLTVFDLSRLAEADRRHAIEATAARVQRSLDLTRGPLLRMAYYDLGRGRTGRLLVVIHHLAVDGVSWRILLEDLESAYAQLLMGEAVRLTAKTTSWKAWAERLAEHAASEALAREADYWVEQSRRETAALPVDDPAWESATARPGSVSVRLGEEETEALLREVPQAYRTQIDEVLLTALAAALARWTGRRRVRIDLEGHGREEEAVGGVDLSRTVGWFTTVYPVVLELPEGRGTGAALKAVKEQLRTVPQRGIGYGLLRYLRGGEAGANLARAAKAEVGFNYLGQFDQVVSAESFFAFGEESAGAAVDARSARQHLLEVSGSVRAGCLELQIGYEEGAHRRETMERLAEWYAGELRELIAHCAAEEAGGYTPSDFPLMQLDEGMLALLEEDFGDAGDLELDEV